MAQNTSGLNTILSVPRIYTILQNLLSGHESRTHFIQTYIRPQAGMRILDLGCGPASILKHLPEGVDYVGIDSENKYIEDAQKAYGTLGTFLCVPIESAENYDIGGFDLILGIGVLHHLDDDQAQSFFKILYKSLLPGGRCVTMDPCIIDNQNWIARLVMSMDRGKNIRTAENYYRLAEKHFKNIKYTILNNRLRIPYTHFIMECMNAASE